MTPVPHLHSIRARYTTIATALSLIVAVMIGLSLDLAVRYKVQDDSFFEAERAAGLWSAAVRNGALPNPIPTSTSADLVQLVDIHGRVVASSPQAANQPPVSTHRPPPGDRLNKLTECSRDRCLILMANRVTPAADSPVVYAGMAEPSILATHRLEYLIAAGALMIVILAAWTTWWAVGRTLLPVAAIRARIAEITVSDLSLRVPMPPGEDEIALLASTANRTLERLEEAVEQQRQFASTASHELRTPLTGLRAQLEEALLYPDSVDVRGSVHNALSACDRLEAIVNDLLLAARLRAADPEPHEPVELGALVRQEAAQVHAVPVDVRAPFHVWVHGSRIQLMRVIDNLLSNAQRHAESRVTVSVERADGQAVVAVVDDGAGIAPADRQRVFERFTRLEEGRRRDSGGSGLGLAISLDITRAHRGTLRIEDSPRGARFVLRLPLLNDDHVAGDAPAADIADGVPNATT
ncbi:two-component sensor histidine kinase [Planotetraspora thailandica]|uniref:histidine kinase n=1 Tax=Planotetraspora thailandica TaxID=487172 RepID=A0A8J3XW47_9ACTN|nr:HAMP domain-containing sensor histidine kinase [Planotetraspora thailandica]GII54366.1 two-component sensor histidine kinase [Planotetraspora thailandica]